MSTYKDRCQNDRGSDGSKAYHWSNHQYLEDRLQGNRYNATGLMNHLIVNNKATYHKPLAYQLHDGKYGKRNIDIFQMVKERIII